MLILSLNIVLVEPEIPQNTGNIIRTCAVAGCSLHLVRPLGFSMEDKYLKRSGLDYWEYVNISYYDNLRDFFSLNSKGTFYLSTTKGRIKYTDIKYKDNCYILFGKETAGLPKWLLIENMDKCIKIPMINEVRSLNLSNSVAIVIYEIMRQLDFLEMT